MKSFLYGAMTAGFMAVSLFADSTAATWDLSKKNNFMLYWGQNAHGSYNATDNKQQQRLIEYCKDTAVDVSCCSAASGPELTTPSAYLDRLPALAQPHVTLVKPRRPANRQFLKPVRPHLHRQPAPLLP